MRYSGRVLSTITKMLVLAACTDALGQVASREIPAHKSAIVLFDGKDLKNFDTFLKSKGLNSDPEHVFQVEKGVIHVSGKDMGYIITKKEYQNFYLRAEFKWGEGPMEAARGRLGIAASSTTCRGRSRRSGHSRLSSRSGGGHGRFLDDRMELL